MLKAQVYFDDEPLVRIFESGDDEGIADLRIDDATPQAADFALHRLGLYRREKWRKVEWGLEARVRVKRT